MKRLIVITSRFPYPLDKGDKLRIYNQIKDLSSQFEIHLFAICDRKPSLNEIMALQPYCSSMHTFTLPRYRRVLSAIVRCFGNMPLKVLYFHSSRIQRKMQEIASRIVPDVVYCQLIRTADYGMKINCKHKVIDFMDCFSEGEKLAQHHSESWIGKAIGKLEWKRTAAYEEAVFTSFNRHCIISVKDRKTFPHKERDRISIISNGVDLDEFYPCQAAKTFDLLFTGNLFYQPNIDAARYLIKQIFPRILAECSDVRLLIAGIGAEQSLRGLASEHITLQSHFNHIRDAFASTKINLVPVISSIGLQNKILQAMAMKIPTIASPSAVLGLGLSADCPFLEMASDPGEFASSTVKLLNDTNRQQHMADLAYNYIVTSGSWQKQNHELISLLQS